MKGTIVAVLLMLVGTAHAELRKLTEADFGTNATVFRSNLLSGADASSGWSQYGISLSSEPSGTPVVRPWVPPCVICVSPRYPVITNETQGNQADTVLIIDFRSPVKKVGLYLIGGNPPLEISIKAADRESNKIGEIKETVGDVGAFVGFEASDQRLISKVVVDYGSAKVPEKLLDLALERASPPRFETVLPQIAHGQLGADLLLRTTISIVNIANTTAGGEIRFYTPRGKAFAPELEGSADPGDAVEFNLGPLEMRRFSTSGKAAMAGWARVVSNAPLQAIAHFDVMAANGQWTETAVTSVEGRFRAVGAYNRDVPASATTGPGPASVPPNPPTVGIGLAIVNLAEDAAFVRLRQVDEEGQAQDAAFSLGPGEQFAQFLDEIWPHPHTAGGTIRMVSDRPMAVILIKTVNGLPVSILPLGSLED